MAGVGGARAACEGGGWGVGGRERGGIGGVGDGDGGVLRASWVVFVGVDEEVPLETGRECSAGWLCEWRAGGVMQCERYEGIGGVKMVSFGESFMVHRL